MDNISGFDDLFANSSGFTLVADESILVEDPVGSVFDGITTGAGGTGFEDGLLVFPAAGCLKLSAN
ncbi:MAG TPA: hypothetical protein PKI44_06700, partial [Candidatus Omnitrophota bacterium]|nr:hypothetical protein [Candidatus Omnitrophota bacterium]